MTAQSIGIDLTAFSDPSTVREKLLTLLQRDISFDPSRPEEVEAAIRTIQTRLDEYANKLGNNAGVQATISSMKHQVREHILDLAQTRRNHKADHIEE
jgi:hypothetical protein